MKNFLTKAFVCAGVVASALALSSIGVFADDLSYGTKTVTDNLTKWDYSSASNNDTASQGDVIDDIYLQTKGTFKVASNALSMKGSTLYLPINDTTKRVDIKVTSSTDADDRKAIIDEQDDYFVVCRKNGSEIKNVNLKNIKTVNNKKYISFAASADDDFKIKILELTEYSTTAAGLTIEKKTVTLSPNKSATITATPVGSSSASVTWSKKSGSENITFTQSENNITVTASSAVTDSDTAVFTARTTINDVVYTEDLTVDISLFKVDYDVNKGLTQNTELFNFTGYSLAEPYHNTGVMLSDGTTQTTFTKAALASGTSSNNSTSVKFEVNLKKDDKIGIYYTISDKNFSSSNQTKGGALKIDLGGTNVHTNSSEANKVDNYAYYDEYTAESDGTYLIYTSKNRLAVWGLNYTPATSTTQSYFTPTAVINYDGNTYIVGSITKSAFENVGGKIGLAGSKTDTTLTEKTAPATTNGSSDTVYKAIMVGGKVLIGDPDAEDPDTYYYAVKLPGTGSTYHIKGFAQLEKDGPYVGSAVSSPAITNK